MFALFVKSAFFLGVKVVGYVLTHAFIEICDGGWVRVAGSIYHFLVIFNQGIYIRGS